MNFTDKYYNYIINKVEVPKEEKIVFEILDDLRDRRGISSEWDSIDNDIKNEIIANWILITKEVINEIP